MPGRRSGPLWAVTTYFNPCGYARRRANYGLFRRRLAVPLLAVELAYGADFELGDDDAEILVRLRGSDVLWQKERLLNVARRFLPPECRFVACLDGDIVFERDDWAEAAAAELERVPLVQPFGRLQRLPRDAMPGDAAEWTLPSTPAALASGRRIEQCLTLDQTQGHLWSSLGVAWAARRELLDDHGLFDACIVGGGDRALICGIWGCFDNLFTGQCMNDRQRAYYMEWATPFHAAVRGAAGFVPGDVFHLWHGTFANRRLRERHVGLAKHGFDPYTDLALDGAGCWRWNSTKPELHAYVRDYFRLRQESE
jgi:hypothetical protein